MKQATIQLETLSCPSCLQKIENAVKGLDGVVKDSVKVMFNASKVKTEFDEAKISMDQINQAIEALGYGVLKAKTRAI